MMSRLNFYGKSGWVLIAGSLLIQCQLHSSFAGDPIKPTPTPSGKPSESELALAHKRIFTKPADPNSTKQILLGAGDLGLIYGALKVKHPAEAKALQIKEEAIRREAQLLKAPTSAKMRQDRVEALLADFRFRERIIYRNAHGQLVRGDEYDYGERIDALKKAQEAARREPIVPHSMREEVLAAAKAESGKWTANLKQTLAKPSVRAFNVLRGLVAVGALIDLFERQYLVQDLLVDPTLSPVGEITGANALAGRFVGSVDKSLNNKATAADHSAAAQAAAKQSTSYR